MYLAYGDMEVCGIWPKGSFEILDDPFDKIGKHCRSNNSVIIP